MSLHSEAAKKEVAREMERSSKESGTEEHEERVHNNHVIHTYSGT